MFGRTRSTLLRSLSNISQLKCWFTVWLCLAIQRSKSACFWSLTCSFVCFFGFPRSGRLKAPFYILALSFRVILKYPSLIPSKDMFQKNGDHSFLFCSCESNFWTYFQADISYSQWVKISWTQIQLLPDHFDLQPTLMNKVFFQIFNGSHLPLPKENVLNQQTIWVLDKTLSQ